MKQVPLTINYDQNPIGKVEFDEKVEKLLASHKYIIAPGFIIKGQNAKGEIKEMELVELSIIPWEKYNKE